MAPINATRAAAVAAAVVNSTIVPMTHNKSLNHSRVVPAHNSSAPSGVHLASARAALVRSLPASTWMEPVKAVKCLAQLSNVLLQLSPVRTMREIQQAGSTLDYPPFPIFVLFFLWLQWSFYATVGLLVTGDTGMTDLLRANCGGVVLGAIYIYCFRQNCNDNEKNESLMRLLRGGAGLLAFEVLCLVLLAHQTALRVIGTICAFLSILSSASPLVAIEDIFRTQSVATMQTDMVIVCFSGSCAWATLGFLMHDMCIAVPNCFGIVVGGLQVHFIVKFAEKSPWRKESSAKQDTSSKLLKTMNGPIGQDAGKAAAEEDYEASVYLSTKVFVLVALAHLHFIVSHYAGFAADTVWEVCAWVSELSRNPPKGCFKCHLRPWRSMRGSMEAADRDSGESLGLL